MESYILENEDGIDFSQGLITGGEFSSDKLVLYIKNAVVRSGCSLNGTGLMRVTLSSPAVESAFYPERRYLAAGNAVKVKKSRSLYKSEQAELPERLCREGGDIFALSPDFSGEPFKVRAEVLFTGGELAEAVISCTGFRAEWEEWGGPVPEKKLTLGERAAVLKRDIPALFLAMGHKDTPFAARLLCCIAAAYALSPVDLIPDFIPLLGRLDDLIILPLLIAAAVRLIPPSVMAECRKKAEGMWEKGRPKKWYYALPVIIIWAVVIIFIIKMIKE